MQHNNEKLSVWGELSPLVIDPLIRSALAEDIGTGDITTDSVIPPSTQISGRLIAKENGCICGLPVFCRVYALLDPAVSIELVANEGSTVIKGDIIARISGPARAILTGERVALNYLQRLSGIASKTAWAVDQVAGTRARITDTRKTTPGLRVLEKYAVRVGGGSNHRFNLSDGILIKDNHIQAAGSITAAVTAARARAPHTLKIEVEVEDSAMIAEALACRADIIMLDNMGQAAIEAAVSQIDGRALIEISGNMGDRDLKALAATGIDLISIGALTHTVKAMDISLRFEPLQVKSEG
ncbi:MAG TPA: carboxylating nicotinate-nucleotide diphosphorylase [Clostridiales bacterium]|nr:carboxylating nicotinate-nucleotide diphosphorylase [Clostridiales bacterium]